MDKEVKYVLKMELNISMENNLIKNEIFFCI